MKRNKSNECRAKYWNSTYRYRYNLLKNMDKVFLIMINKGKVA